MAAFNFDVYMIHPATRLGLRKAPIFSFHILVPTLEFVPDTLSTRRHGPTHGCRIV